MSVQNARRLVVLLVLSSLGSAGLGVLPGGGASHNDDHPDPLQGEPAEWEEQVASDARGDTLIRWRGSIDLYYATIGEIYSWSAGDSFLIMRIGYNITDDPDDETVPLGEVPDVPGAPGLPSPELAPEEPVILVNVTANISGERTLRFSLFSNTYGRSWGSDQGRLIADNGEVDGHREVVYIAPLRRFGLEEGDTLSAWNITSYREARLVDTMAGYDPANDYLPRYVPLKPILEDPTAPLQNLPIPLPVPLPGSPVPPEPPVPLPPLPVPTPEPMDHVPEDPYPYPHDGPLPVGVPYGAPVPDEIEPPGQGHDPDLVPVDPGRIVEDPQSGMAWNVTHRVTAGFSRLVARAESEIVGASTQEVGFVNFTLESRFEEIDQLVMMFVVGPTDSRWLMRYGLDMPTGTKTLPGGGRVNMSAIVAPSSLFATPRVTYTFLFLSNWGGFDFVPVTFVTTNQAQLPLTGDEGLPDLPEVLIVDLVNADDPFRVNEPRKIMIQTLRGDNGKFQPDMKAVRAYIFPVGQNPGQPYQFTQKNFMPGVYEIDFVFHRPGAWVVNVWFFDYPPDDEDTFPSVLFNVTVDYEGKSSPLMPFPFALGSVGLIVGAVMLRERLTKNR